MQKRLRFGLYVLDLDRGSLLRGATEVVLRPKTFGVLVYLVENSSRLVSKDELFAAVWPNVAVTDDALVQSIGELRRALGDDGPRLIKTVPRRGYRFESDVAIERLSDAAPANLYRFPPSRSMRLNRRKPVPVQSCLRLSRLRGLARVSESWLQALASSSFLRERSGSAPTENPCAMQEPAEPSTTRSVEASTKPAIAILPIVNQSDDSTYEYFADGVTQDLIDAMGRFSELTVMSWNAVSPYKGKRASPGEIARALAVRYQVEGSVRRTGDGVRISARLVDMMAGCSGPAARTGR
jgi:DNA-binding winged helix-turn-helix (wHTH) protein/TolB-like protein